MNDAYLADVPRETSRQAVYRSREGFEKVDPVPVAHLSPVPSLKEQLRELLLKEPETVRGWIEQEQSEEQNFSDLDFEFEEPEPEWVSGFEVIDMADEYLPPEDKTASGQTSDGDALMGDSAPVQTAGVLPDSGTAADLSEKA